MSKTASRILIGLSALFVVAGVAAYVVLGQLGRIIERGVETAGPKITGTDVDLGSAWVSIFDGEGALRNLEIGNPAGFTSDQAFDLGEISIAVDLRSVTSDVVRIRSLVVRAPRLIAEFDAAGASNLDKILAHAKGAARRGGGGSKDADKDPAANTRLIIDEFRFESASVQVLAPAFDVDKSLKLQPIVLKGLGAKQGGAAASDLAQQVLRPVIEAAVRAAMQEYLAAQREKLGDKAKDKLLDKLFQK